MDVAIITNSQKSIQSRINHLRQLSKNNSVLETWVTRHFPRDNVSSLVWPEDMVLQNALVSRGLTAKTFAWDDPSVDWSKTKLCIIRSAVWKHRTDEFFKWAESAQKVSHIWNSVEIMRWVSNKAYINDLAARNIPIVSTRIFNPGNEVDLMSVLKGENWNEVIIKPLIGEGAENLIRASLVGREGYVNTNDAQIHLNKLLLGHGALIQPFLPSVAENGEFSAIFIQGRITHAVRRHAIKGSFITYGFPFSEEDLIPLTNEILELAESVFRAINLPLQMGRADMVLNKDKKLVLLELELVRPRLFLESSPEALEYMADQICSYILRESN